MRHVIIIYLLRQKLKVLPKFNKVDHKKQYCIKFCFVTVSDDRLRDDGIEQ